MNCLKCGNETSNHQIFCDGCLEIMQRYPIKPGTAIHLPHRPAPTGEKKPHDKRRESEEKDPLVQLQGMIRWLTATIAVLSVLLLLTASMLIHTLDQESTQKNIGRNYTTSDSANRP